MREVRCHSAPETGTSPCNTWSGTGGDGGLRSYWAVRAIVEGAIDRASGYLCDIKALDAVLREAVVPPLRELPPGSDTLAHLGTALLAGFRAATQRVPRVVALRRLELLLSPYLSVAIVAGSSCMLRVTQSFEFSAAHRLWCANWTDEENRRVFGKCSNPHGHGHNYVLEVTLAGDPDGRTGAIIELPAFNRIVKEHVLEALDHRNLNLECPEFAATNPTVENIARAIFERLLPAFPPGRLAGVRVWETAKTYAEYGGDESMPAG